MGKERGGNSFIGCGNLYYCCRAHEALFFPLLQEKGAGRRDGKELTLAPGVLEGIRITRLGFPNRTIYAEFVQRYYLLIPDVPRKPQDPKPATASILKGLKIPESEYRFGLTKVFFRAGQLAYIEVSYLFCSALLCASLP